MSKKKSEIRVSFIGENAEHVTGSMTLVEMNVEGKTRKILLEAGLFQSNSLKKDYEVNSRRFKGFKPKEIEYIFIQHFHGDHQFLLGRLYAEGCRAKIIVPKDSRDFMSVLLRDCAYIMCRDAEELNRTSKSKKNYKPLFIEDDVDTLIQYVEEYDFNTLYMIDENISFEFLPAQHIIRSAQLKLYLTVKNRTRTILYTSDLGNIKLNKPYVEKFVPCKKADLVIGEATYASKEREISNKDRQNDINKIKSIIEMTCIDKKSRVLIPSFSLDRTQFILTMIYQLFGKDENFKIPVVVDSPLSCKISNLYSKLLEGEDKKLWDEVCNWKNVRFISDSDASKAFVTDKTPAVCISSSGMMNAGRVRKYVKEILPDRNASIMFIGYSSENTLASKIKRGKEQHTISVDNKKYPNRCQIYDLRSFSGHMMRNDLLNYYSDINCEKIALVHSNFNDKVDFAKDLQEEISRKNKCSKVIVVNKSTSINL